MPDPTRPHAGRLEVILGCMFSGKTTELIRRLRDAAGRGQAAIALKPRRDTRYADAALATHTGDHLAAVAIEDAGALHAAAGHFAVIGIDEGHFFGPALTDAAIALRNQGRRVIVAGVALDHFGRPFEPFPALACAAEEVVKLTAPCAVCGGPAIHSQRMIAGGGRIVVGGAESYQARCARCFEPSVQ